MENITIGYLTWKKHKHFEKTLKSHKDNGLFDLIPPKNRIVFIQELDDETIEVVKKYECNYIGNEKNIGMLEAYIELVENCKTEYFIFCENDFVLMKNTDVFNNFEIKKTLEDTINILKENKNSQVKLSNIKKPGYLVSRTKVHPIEKFLIRDQNSFSFKIESFSWIDDPINFYKNTKIDTIQQNYKWYSLDLKHQDWSNHVHACCIKFSKEIIIPLFKFAKYNYPHINILYSGIEQSFRNTEKYQGKDPEIDKLIEEFKSIKIISGGGNFYHNRVNPRKTDDFYNNQYC